MAYRESYSVRILTVPYCDCCFLHTDKWSVGCVHVTVSDIQLGHRVNSKVFEHNINLLRRSIQAKISLFIVSKLTLSNRFKCKNVTGDLDTLVL